MSTVIDEPRLGVGEGREREDIEGEHIEREGTDGEGIEGEDIGGEGIEGEDIGGEDIEWEGTEVVDVDAYRDVQGGATLPTGNPNDQPDTPGTPSPDSDMHTLPAPFFAFSQRIHVHPATFLHYPVCIQNIRFLPRPEHSHYLRM